MGYWYQVPSVSEWVQESIPRYGKAHSTYYPVDTQSTCVHSIARPTPLPPLILLRVKLCVSYCCLVTKSCLTLLWPHDFSPPDFSVQGFPKQEYWRGLPSPSPGDLPDQGLNPHLLVGRHILYHWVTREAHCLLLQIIQVKILESHTIANSRGTNLPTNHAVLPLMLF